MELKEGFKIRLELCLCGIAFYTTLLSALFGTTEFQARQSCICKALATF
jgi:hypothetical protein